MNSAARRPRKEKKKGGACADEFEQPAEVVPCGCVLWFNPMPSYVVYLRANDGVTEDGVVSTWDDIGDAYAAAGEAKAMDPENSYEVQVESDGPVW